MLSLHKGDYGKAREFENEIQANPKLKSRQFYSLGDFEPSGESYSSNYLKILIDSRVSDLSSYLISDLSKAEEWISKKFPEIESNLTYFFMEGSGPSPFNAQLGDIYLKVGHYNPVPNDRELVQHAIIHELTHIYLRNRIGFTIRESEFGIRKFFDEGFAQYCGFKAVNAYKRKLAHADACSAAVIKTGLEGLNRRIETWLETLFNEKHYPLYQAALSFIGYMETQFGYEGLIDLLRDTGHDDNFPNSIHKKTGTPIQNHLRQWVRQLPDLQEIAKDDFCEITLFGRHSETELTLSYESSFPLYPLNDFLVFNEKGVQLATRINRSKRYEKSGEVFVTCSTGEGLSAVIVHDGNVQLAEIRNCV